MKKCYIAGKIGNLSKEVYEANFKKAEVIVSELGFEPISPLNIHGNCEHEINWLAFMRCDLSALLKCDAVYALSNWVTSPGATIEVELAHKLGIKVIYQNQMQSHYLQNVKAGILPNVEVIQEQDLKNIKRHGTSNNKI